MGAVATPLRHAETHPVAVTVEPALDARNRLTVAFRPLLALPHLILVGAPLAVPLTWTWGAEPGTRYELGTAGALGAAAVVVAVVSWFAILFTGRQPDGLWQLAAYYLRWRVRAVAYMALLRDEYPPFGDGAYPAAVSLRPTDAPRDRLAVAFRPLLAFPHVVAVWALGVGWLFTTAIAWVAIVLTGRYPAPLHRFGVGVLRWGTRVEAYLLLLHDEYPPFSLA